MHWIADHWPAVLICWIGLVLVWCIWNDKFWNKTGKDTDP